MGDVQRDAGLREVQRAMLKGVWIDIRLLFWRAVLRFQNWRVRRLHEALAAVRIDVEHKKEELERLQRDVQ